MLHVLEAAEHQHQHLDAEMQGSMRLFRAQRNFYISGFALFLSLVSAINLGVTKDFVLFNIMNMFFFYGRLLDGW